MKSRLGLAATFLVPGLLGAVLVLLLWQIKPPPVYTLDLGNPDTEASNFYTVERGEVAFRWSKVLSGVSLPALSWSQAVTVTANPARPTGAEYPWIKLLGNGGTLSSMATKPGWIPYSASAQAGLLPDLRLLIESDTFYPSASDKRRLGVAISTISTEPIRGKLGLFYPPPLWVLLCFAASLAASVVHRRAWTWAFAAVAALGVPAMAALLPPRFALPASAWVVGALVAFGLFAGLWPYLDGDGALATRIHSVLTSRWELPLVGAAVLAVSILFTWPLAAGVAGVLPGWPGDNFAFLYKLWWFRTALLSRHVSPLFDPNTFAPFGFNLGQGEPTLANTLPGVPLGAVFGDVAAYNILALFSFIVSGIGAYLLVREITGRRAPAVLAAFAFAFVPYRMSQFAGHIQLLGTGWIALSFYFAERTFRTRKARFAGAAGVALAFAALSAWYYALMAGMLLFAYVLIRVWQERKLWDVRALLQSLAAFVLALLLLAGPAALPSLSLYGRGGLAHSAKAADEHSASPLDYVVPNPLHPVWGETFMQAHADQNVIESSLYVGLVVVVMALVALFAAGRISPSTAQVRRAWVVVVVAAFVLSLGLTLHGLEGQIQLNGGPIPLPGLALFNWLPLFSSMRAYARFGVMVVLALVVLMGIGWGVAVGGRRRSNQLTLLLICGVLADFWTAPYAWGTSRVETSATAAYMRTLPLGPATQMPLESSLTGPALFAASRYNRAVAYGYDTFEPEQWRSARPDLAKFPQDRSLDLLRRWGVRYVIVSANAYGAEWPATLDYLRSLPRLKFLSMQKEQRIWNVDPAVIDARPDMEPYLDPDTTAVFELLR